jgi:hypothetical protein
MSESLTEDRIRIIIREEVNGRYISADSCKERHIFEEKMIGELKIVVEKQSAKLDKIIILLITACVGLIFDLLFRFITK